MTAKKSTPNFPSNSPELLSRRRLLKGAAGFGVAVAAQALMPFNVRRVLAQGIPARGSLADIKHVVLLMQENRSFDHYFGTLSGVRGFNDPKARKLMTGKSVFYQPDAVSPDGYMLPFHLNTRTSSAQKILSTSHAWGGQHEAWNRGQVDKWLPAHRKADKENRPYCMGYYTRDDIPFQFALAESFTLCDAYYCSVMGPTWPNRMYYMTGMIDPDGIGGGPITRNVMPPGGYGWKTYPERLEEAGVSWKIYQQEDNYECNMLELFKAYQQAPTSSALYKKGMLRGQEGQFEYDAINDKLPTVSWIITTSFQSEHPDCMPADGAAFVASKIDAITVNPDVWAKTLFILNYDENDGIFDHVPLRVPKDGTPHEFVDGVPIGAGFRVPCILISPWTAGGYVCSDPFDHTSTLRFLEKLTGVREPNITDWRRSTFGDMTSALRFDGAKKEPPSLPDTSGHLRLAEYESTFLLRPVFPTTNQKLPEQEKDRTRKASRTEP